MCLPDDAAISACELANGQCRLLDASTAHRTHSDWVYGLPELNAAARTAIASADKVSNPGCYPQGFILSVLPLIEAGLLDAATPLRCYAVSGYSGGGRQMIESFQARTKTQADALNTQAYGLTQSHKHLPEMQHYSGCDKHPFSYPPLPTTIKACWSAFPCSLTNSAVPLQKMFSAYWRNAMRASGLSSASC
ncbi:MAG: hypothetical protein CM15mP68_1380 [Pseudomonadota bacterium]|nr:MAG: hypothetical protein CM15mP68_1380 [Pseudomonadota bacterium]